MLGINRIYICNYISYVLPSNSAYLWAILDQQIKVENVTVFLIHSMPCIDYDLSFNVNDIRALESLATLVLILILILIIILNSNTLVNKEMFLKELKPNWVHKSQSRVINERMHILCSSICFTGAADMQLVTKGI